MNNLSEKDVKHVANLARIYIKEEEIPKYMMNLQSLLNEVDKIRDIEGYDDEMLITPVEHETIPRKDEMKETLTFKEVSYLAPKVSGNYIEVPVMIHE